MEIEVVHEHRDIVILESVNFRNILCLESMLGYWTEERYLKKRLIIA